MDTNKLVEVVTQDQGTAAPPEAAPEQFVVGITRQGISTFHGPFSAEEADAISQEVQWPSSAEVIPLSPIEPQHRDIRGWRDTPFPDDVGFR